MDGPGDGGDCKAHGVGREEREMKIVFHEAELGEDWDITDEELKRRLLLITAGDYREGDIEILLHGEGEDK